MSGLTTKICRQLILLVCLAELVLATGQAGAAQAQAKELRLVIWTRYMNPEVIDKFEQKYDVNVVIGHYGSLPELFAKLVAGGVYKYDVIVPSNYYVPRLIELGLIQPLDKELIPNYDNLMAKFRNPPYDPGGRYTSAYQWGTTGIVYNA